MRCYTVRENKIDGIDLVEYESDLYIQIGKPVGSYIPLGKTLRDTVSKLNSEAGLTALPRIAKASFSSDGQRLIGETKRDRFALVKVETSAGDNGRLIYTARSYDGYNGGGRVRHRHHDFVGHDPALGPLSWEGVPDAGIEVVACGMGPQQEAECLLILTPGGGIRLRRTGDVGDATPEIHVLWTGDILLCFTPKRFKKDRAA